jgi:hypothetical protein
MMGWSSAGRHPWLLGIAIATVWREVECQEMTNGVLSGARGKQLDGWVVVVVVEVVLS